MNLKIFSLDKNHHSLRGKKPDDVIQEIVSNHKNKLFQINSAAKADSLLEKYYDGDFKVWSYCFNHTKDNYHWKAFLPSEFGSKQNFEIVEFSYVLFLLYKNEFYCVIGGTGMMVIKKYLDNSFGIDIYQHFAKPKEDILIDLSMRSISGNVSQSKYTYNQNQTIFDSLNYSEIPSKIKLIIRDDLIKSLFKKYSLPKNRPILEVGNYFYIKKKINYNTLKSLIIDVDKIRSNKDNFQELTLFKKVKDLSLIESLDKELVKLVVDDVLSLNSPLGRLANTDIIEIVHPTKLEKFYECNNFTIKLSKLREDKSINVTGRNKLYIECVRYIFSQCNNTLDEKEIRDKFFKTDIRGFHNKDFLTIGRLFIHLTAELFLNGKKFFRIDTVWYFLSDEYLKRLKAEAVLCYNDNLLTDNILNSWVGGDEDEYNKSHIGMPHYYILDKTFKENIELCDILKITENKIYFIHVKNGFDTSMRDLCVQVILSAKRLWNDLNNTDEISFLKNTLDYYNSKKISKGNKIDVKKVIQGIVKRELEIIFVMAYNNYSYVGKSGGDKIKSSKSNIAQYSLVQTTREMKALSSFKFKIIDISQIF